MLTGRSLDVSTDGRTTRKHNAVADAQIHRELCIIIIFYALGSKDPKG